MELLEIVDLHIAHPRILKLGRRRRVLDDRIYQQVRNVVGDGSAMAPRTNDLEFILYQTAPSRKRGGADKSASVEVFEQLSGQKKSKGEAKSKFISFFLFLWRFGGLVLRLD